MNGIARRTMFAVFTGAVLLAPVPGRAQTLVAEVGGSLMQQILTQINTYMQTYQDEIEYSTEAKRWYDTYSHYQQQLVRAKGMVNSFRLPAGQALETVDPGYMVAERCGGLPAGTSVLQALVPARNGDYIGQQKTVCQQLQRAQNARYNDTVTFLNQTIPELDRDMSLLAGQRNSSNSNGNVQASIENATRMQVTIEAAMKKFKARIDGYDAYMATLQDAQRQLTQMALQGERNPIGTLVKTGALKAALKTRD